MSRTQKLDLNRERENRQRYRQTRRIDFEKRLTRRTLQLEAVEKLEAALDAGDSASDLQAAIDNATSLGLECGTRRTVTRHPALHEAMTELEKLVQKLQREQVRDGRSNWLGRLCHGVGGGRGGRGGRGGAGGAGGAGDSRGADGGSRRDAR
jgi:hypothetical protein